jgi:MerR family transcriptional regulator/heat shock protein HspR
MTKKRGKGAYMISAVAEMYGIHPQTLRLYEREGLLAPSRSEGNTRLYTEEDLKRLEFILELAREFGVNISGIDMILRMRERMETMKKQMDLMQSQMQEFIRYVQTEMIQRVASASANPSAGALVPVRRAMTPEKKK